MDRNLTRIPSNLLVPKMQQLVESLINSTTNGFAGKTIKTHKWQKWMTTTNKTKQNHYVPPQHSPYNRNDSNKRPNSNYNRATYQDKRARNDRGRSNSRDRSNSQTRSPRSPRSPGGDNHRNGPYFYDEKKKY
jgi:hypothetical protein